MKISTNVKLSAQCMSCLITRQMEDLKDTASEEMKSAYMREVFQIIGAALPEDTAPVLIAKINVLHEKYFGHAYSFEQLKKDYNHMMLEAEDRIRARIARAEDPVYHGILYARVGNYIDFGAMGSVSDEKLRELIEKAEEETLDPAEYRRFTEQMETAKSLVYLTDNCGEIVLDKLLIEQLSEEVSADTYHSHCTGRAGHQRRHHRGRPNDRSYRPGACDRQWHENCRHKPEGYLRGGQGSDQPCRCDPFKRPGQF